MLKGGILLEIISRRSGFSKGIVFAAVLLFIVGCSVPRKVIDNHNSISIIETPLINGIEQAIIIRGHDVSKPLLVHVHGGPGYPLFPYIDNFAELEKHFTVVYWEQRGTAKSLNSNVSDESMATDTLLVDLHNVVEWAKRKVGKKKVFLWGHSWGSNLGMLYIKKYPENIKAYIGTGQSVDLYQNERLCFRYAMESAKNDSNKVAIKELSKIDTLNYTLSEALLVRKWVYTYGGIVHKVNSEKSYVNLDIVKDVFRTPEYSFLDKWRLILRSKYSGKTLWDDMMAINLFEQVKSVDVPVYFFLGKYDHLVSSSLAEKYFNVLNTTSVKEIVWFSKSAHRMQTEEPEKFISEILRVKRQNN